MSLVTLPYVGPAPTSNSNLVTKAYADAQAAATIVNTAYVNNQIALATENLTTQTYVDAQNQLLVQIAQVTAADANYVQASQLGVASGLAQCDSSGDLTAAQVPSGLKTDRVAQCYSVGYTTGNPVGGLASSTTGAIGTAYLSAGSSHTVTTTSAREFKLASIPIPDPGYLWRAWPFGWIQGNTLGSTAPVDRAQGTGSYGLVTVMPPATVSNQVYGVGIASGNYTNDWYPILPYAAPSQTPTSVPPIAGALELDLYACCWSGSPYTFNGGFSFWVLCLPAFS